MRDWVVVSSGLAPVALIGGWSLAASRQPARYDPLRDTISALAAQGAVDRWIMTAGLALLGLAHVVSAAGLTDIGPPARALLALGGAATAAVAALPQPNPGHVPAATVGFIALALWPAFAAVRPRRAGVAGTAVLVILLIWLAVELRGGALLGLSERLLAGAEALVPFGLAVVLIRRRRGAIPG